MTDEQVNAAHWPPRRTPLNRQVKAELYTRGNGRCYLCGEPIVLGDPDKYPEYDHVQPFSAGGKDDSTNLALACHSCNRRKGSRPLEIYLAGNPARARVMAELERQGIALSIVQHKPSTRNGNKGSTAKGCGLALLVLLLVALVVSIIRTVVSFVADHPGVLVAAAVVTVVIVLGVVIRKAI